MIQTYKKICQLLSNHERKRAIQLLIIMILMAFFEVLGVGSIMPFLSVLGNPEVIETNEYLAFLYSYFSFESKDTFLIFLGVFALVMLIISAIFRSLALYATARFSNMRRHSISRQLLSKYLHQPYSFFLSRNSSEISKTILSEVDIFIIQVMQPSLQLITYIVVTIALTSFLIAIDPILALILVALFGTFYSVTYLIIRKYLTKIGLELQKANEKRFKIVSETIGGIKDLKVLGRESVYLSSFDKPSENFSSYQATSATLSQVPQYIVEVLAFGSLLVMAMYTIVSNDADLGTMLPILGLYALGALKLKPAIQTIYSSISSLRFGQPALETILKDLQQKSEQEISISNDFKRVTLQKELQLKNINFNYPNTTTLALTDISIDIEANSTVGIIGTTGAGKSTLVDIILGLLLPTSGEIRIDDEVLSSTNIRQWQNSIGYVPQSIFLADDTIASNIAFGVEKEQIDIDQVQRVSKMAQVHEFVTELKNGYNTIIGERGVRLSGGQRQRLGIARALYNNPELLVLDEATSALDNQTEAEVMKAIDNMSGSKTIIMIAHRLSTVEKCDKIIKLEKGLIYSE
ncbi:MAG: ABC transporter ATP-binding protein [Arcobacteraceae bacterium]